MPSEQSRVLETDLKVYQIIRALSYGSRHRYRTWQVSFQFAGVVLRRARSRMGRVESSADALLGFI